MRNAPCSSLWNWTAFDLAVVDESSMATFPLTFIGLLHARSFVLVGDHHQLPLIVRSDRVPPAAKVSLFESLIGSYPDASTLLSTQYRSNAAIAEFANRHIYGGRVQTDPSVANRRLPLNGTTSRVLNPDNVVVWVTHAFPPRWEQRQSTGGFSAWNEGEAALALRLVGLLREAGVGPDDVAVVAPYRLQADLLKKAASILFPRENDWRRWLSSFGDGEEPPARADAQTVDSYQGRQKEVVVVGFVQNVAHKAINDYRRLNVAVSRARSKVIVLGHRELLHSRWGSAANPASLHRFVGGLGDGGCVLDAGGVGRLEREMEAVRAARKEMEGPGGVGFSIPRP